MKGQIVCVIDGSQSSLEAGNMAIEIALALKLPLKVVYILDEGLKHLLGDEWMSNSSARLHFFNWFENGVNLDSESLLHEFSKTAKTKGAKVETQIKIGKPEKVIIDLTNEKETALLVLPNPHGTPSTKEVSLTFNLNTLIKKIKCPIYTGPRI